MTTALTPATKYVDELPTELGAADSTVRERRFATVFVNRLGFLHRSVAGRVFVDDIMQVWKMC